jgi:hypothetical protein
MRTRKGHVILRRRKPQLPSFEGEPGPGSRCNLMTWVSPWGSCHGFCAHDFKNAQGLCRRCRWSGPEGSRRLSLTAASFTHSTRCPTGTTGSRGLVRHVAGRRMRHCCRMQVRPCVQSKRVAGPSGTRSLYTSGARPSGPMVPLLWLTRLPCGVVTSRLATYCVPSLRQFNAALPV